MADFPTLETIIDSLTSVRLDVMHAIQRSNNDFESMLQSVTERTNGIADSDLDVTGSEFSTPPDDSSSTSDVTLTTVVTEFPEALERVLQYIADSGDGRTPVSLNWETELRPLLLARLAFNLRTNFNMNEKVPHYPNTLVYTMEEKKSDVVDRILSFCSCPFTIQRLCELLCKPTTHYKRVDRYLRAVERVITISSTIEFPPIGDSTDLSILMPAQRFAAQLAAGEVGDEWLSNGIADDDEEEDYPSADVAASAMLILRGPTGNASTESNENSTTAELTLRTNPNSTGLTDREFGSISSIVGSRRPADLHDLNDEPAEPTDSNMSSVESKNLHADDNLKDPNTMSTDYSPLPLFSVTSPPTANSTSAFDNELIRRELSISGTADADCVRDETTAGNSNSDSTPPQPVSFDMFATSLEAEDNKPTVLGKISASIAPDVEGMPSLDAAYTETAESEPHANVSYTIREPRRDNLRTSAEVYIPLASNRSPSYSSTENNSLFNNVAEDQRRSDSEATHSAEPSKTDDAIVGEYESVSDYAVDLSKKLEPTTAPLGSTDVLPSVEKPLTPPSETQLPADAVPFNFVVDDDGKSLETSSAVLVVPAALVQEQQTLSSSAADQANKQPVLTSTFTAVLMQPSVAQRSLQKSTTVPITADLEERMDIDDEESNSSAAAVTTPGNNVSSFSSAPISTILSVGGDDEVMQDDDSGSKTLPNVSSSTPPSAVMDEADQQQRTSTTASDEPMQS